MKATSPLFVRLRFTTKDVGGGFYRGNRTGSMGAHTPKGGYIIDYRKVRNYNVPELKDCKLTPYVTKTLPAKTSSEKEYPWEKIHPHLYRYARPPNPTPELRRRRRAMAFVREWRERSSHEFEEVSRHQLNEVLPADLEKYNNGEQATIIEWFIRAQRAESQARDRAFEDEERRNETAIAKLEAQQTRYQRGIRPKNHQQP